MSMKEIRMVDLQTQYQRIKGEIDKAIQQVVSSSSFIQGPEVKGFADALGTYLGDVNVIPCGNGTDALQIAMMALELQPGDEVIVPVHTYVATAEVIALLRLVPVFVDVDPNTFNIDVSRVEERINPRTRAIVPVHLYGQCCDMEPLIAIAARHNLHVIEDTAQALGAEYLFSDGTRKRAGTIGTIGTTSFFPSKNLGCYGDGGAVVCHDRGLSNKVRMIANHGQSEKYRHDLIGVNSRLDTLQAAILNVKLKHLDDYTERRRRAAEYYDRVLAGIKGVRTPYRQKNSTHVFHQYTLCVERRDDLKAFLGRHGIPSVIYYPIPLHLQNAYRDGIHKEGAFPVTEELSRSVLSLPIHTEMTEEELAFICDTIRNFYNG